MMTASSPLHPDNLLRLLRDLVRFPTVNPPGGEEPAARFVERELQAIGCDTVMVPYPQGEGATRRGRAARGRAPGGDGEAGPATRPPGRAPGGGTGSWASRCSRASGQY